MKTEAYEGGHGETHQYFLIEEESAAIRLVWPLYETKEKSTDVIKQITAKLGSNYLAQNGKKITIQRSIKRNRLVSN